MALKGWLVHRIHKIEHFVEARSFFCSCNMLIEMEMEMELEIVMAMAMVMEREVECNS